METPAPSTSDAAIAHKNMVWGWALFGLFWVLFAAMAVDGIVARGAEVSPGVIFVQDPLVASAAAAGR